MLDIHTLCIKIKYNEVGGNQLSIFCLQEFIDLSTLHALQFT